MPPAPPNPIRFAEIWLLLIYCERKILFVRWKSTAEVVLQNMI
jgi:hypothetical protein